jgi:putative acetyltransferase
MSFEIRQDDLSGPEIQALLREHLAGMQADTPPESVHAALEALRQPGITLWSAGAETACAAAARSRRWTPGMASSSPCAPTARSCARAWVRPCSTTSGAQAGHAACCA